MPGLYPPPPDPHTSPVDTPEDVKNFLTEIRRWGDDLIRQLEHRDAQSDAPVGRVYAPTNVTEDRDFNADTVVITELADVVGTLIADLQKKGLIT